MDALKVFRIYLAFCAYFGQTYDNVKYDIQYFLRGGTNTYRDETFHKRGDKVLFESLGKKFDYKHLLAFFLANYIYSDGRVIFDNRDKAIRLMNRYLGNREKMTYIVQRDLNSAKSHISKEYLSGSYLLNHDNDSLTKEINDGTIWVSDPICIFNLYKAGVISMETMVAIDKVTRIVDIFRKEYQEMLTICKYDFKIIRYSNTFFKVNDFTKQFIKNFFNIN